MVIQLNAGTILEVVRTLIWFGALRLALEAATLPSNATLFTEVVLLALLVLFYPRRPWGEVQGAGQDLLVGLCLAACYAWLQRKSGVRTGIHGSRNGLFLVWIVDFSAFLAHKYINE